jgi:hypothetical protein
MIKTLSPYYITTPFVSPATVLTCTSYTLSIYVWSGLQSAVPATASYTITKDNPTASTGDSKVNIAKILNDFITFTPVKATSTVLLDTVNQQWVKTEVTYITTAPADASTPQLGVVNMFTRGYSYGNDGENIATPTNKILMYGNEFNVSRTSYIAVPLQTNLLATATTVISYPDSQINYTVTPNLDDSTGTNEELVSTMLIDATETTTDTYFEVVHNGVTLTYYIIDECRYTPIDIHFCNKEGAQQSITFFKSLTEDISISSEQFESDRGQPSLGFHQFVKYNINGKSKFKVNSGFVDESLNETFKQLLLSDKVYRLVDNTFIPLNVSSSSLEYKTRQKDRLINYEISFDYAYNEINNI